MAATVDETLQDLLQADATLVAIATGGIALDMTDGISPLDEKRTPGAYEEIAGGGGAKQLKPCLLLTASSRTTIGPRGIGNRTFYRLSAYDRDGFVNTRAMLNRARVVLHDVRAQLTSGQNIQIVHVDDPILGSADESVRAYTAAPRPASYEASRYQVDLVW